MLKYRCQICHYIYEDENFEILEDSWTCPSCFAPKSLFKQEEIEEKIQSNSYINAIPIHPSNVAIERIKEKCIDCGICRQTCMIREGMTFDQNSDLCINCGQCIQTCPTGALIPKQAVALLKQAQKEGKICIAYTSPSVRVSLGDLFGKEYGSFEQKKLIGLLRKIGFDYVFDTTFDADLTIVEEASELIERIKENKNLPMFTSCCPAWIKYAEQFYPDILNHISTCKSPIGMMGMVVKEYFSEKTHIPKENIFSVAITPCTAKKYEIKREEIKGTDLVLTVSELRNIIKKENITYEDIEESDYDSFFPEGSGAGVIFGNTGGVMEAALRSAYYYLTNKELSSSIVFQDVRGMDNVKEATIHIENMDIRVAVVHQMSSAKKILEDVKNGTSPYHYIEIMNCLGGCIGGGGQPKIVIEQEKEILQKRIDSLYQEDNKLSIRCSHQNPQIQKLYREFLGNPLSPKAHELLHTTYQDKSSLKGKSLIQS